MNKKYKITLTPVDKFFFGGDMTFQVGTNEKDNFNEQFSSYIIRSAMYPQQTSLIGMLRFLILRNSGEEIFKNGKIIDKAAAEKLIGSKSFSVNKEQPENKEQTKSIFGKIINLSHVRVQRTENGSTFELEYAPLYSEMDWTNSNKSWLGFNEISVPKMSEYDAKKGLQTQLTDGVNWYDFDKVFIEDRRIGIHRNVKIGKTEEGALFKQIAYRFNNKEASHCFVFYAEIAEDVAFKSYNGQLVSVGGDSSYFIIGISDYNTPESLISTIDNAVYLLSPAFLTREDVQLAKFAITDLIPFRFLESSVEAKSYNILNKDVRRSKVKYELYSPGSIFYFEDNEKKNKFIEKLESKKEFRQIGYNEYK